MFDLLPDGSIVIDFSPSDAEPFKVKVGAPPSTGRYKLIRQRIEADNAQRDAFWAEWRANLEKAEAGTLTDEEKASLPGPAAVAIQAQNLAEDLSLAFWLWVMVGDDEVKGLADREPPADFDDWPVYLQAGAAISTAVTHWREVPLARGGVPVEQPL